MFTETCEAPKEISCYSLNHSTQQVESKDCITREEKKKKSQILHDLLPYLTAKETTVATTQSPAIGGPAQITLVSM